MEQLYSRRRHERFEICLAARLEMKNSTITCHTRNVSYGGASLELPFDTGLYDLRSAHCLEIEAISHFKVSLVWNSGNQCGFQFLGSDQAIRKMREYLAEHFNTPASRPAK